MPLAGRAADAAVAVAKNHSFRILGVVGAGQMGSGIAQLGGWFQPA